MKLKRTDSLSQSAKTGYTLVELAVCMAVMAILGVGASSLVLVSVNSSMSNHQHETSLNISQQIFTNLRQDLRFASADSITMSALPDSIITMTGSDGDEIREGIKTVGTKTTFTRKKGTNPERDFTQDQPEMAVTAFVPSRNNRNTDPAALTPGCQVVAQSGTNPAKVVCNYLTVVASNRQGSSAIDNIFGAANTQIEQTNYTLLNGYKFQ